MLARDAVVVASIVVVGASWWLLPETVDLSDSYPLGALVLMTVALAAIFGASMSAVRGFVASAALAAVVAIVLLLTFDVPRPDYSGYAVLVIWLLALGMLIVVPLAWLSGLVSGWVWRRVAGR
jgi:hypothetical protein